MSKYAQAKADVDRRKDDAAHAIVAVLDTIDAFARAEDVVRQAAFGPYDLYRNNDEPIDDDHEQWKCHPFQRGKEDAWLTSAAVAALLVERLGPKRAVARVGEYADAVLGGIADATHALVEL